ncbi:hypothetical protein OOZ51_09660 [Arthrobacter sp. MI7-26]|nr:hypothetical protein [Arthrobacter sp. MI7-26]MCX2748078.1 hypothetical protein [Arthrobacter sp. MI7-26]
MLDDREGGGEDVTAKVGYRRRQKVVDCGVGEEPSVDLDAVRGERVRVFGDVAESDLVAVVADLVAVVADPDGEGAGGVGSLDVVVRVGISGRTAPRSVLWMRSPARRMRANRPSPSIGDSGTARTSSTLHHALTGRSDR